ncbi:MAG: DUF4386 domain-containing protein [Bacteroidetes bacterium]|uniref:DUF4386 domain-containing protein n=1 Tax=Flavobacterium sp. TaxID=239 RepID=UPI002FD88593|nr:DUF4386 domain-containing protein [Bacteroidota bacterium]
MNSKRKTARIAGLLYLGVVITGIFSLMYVPKSLIVWDNATATFNNIVSNQTLFRIGIVSGLICYTFFLFLPLVLYKLLKPVNDNYAKLMVILAIISVPIYFINVQNQFTILSIVSSSNYLNGYSTEQIKSMVMLYLDQYENGMRIVHIFSGLWLFPFGYLVFKSGFLPKFLGILLMLGCFGYLINFFGNTLVSNYSEIGIASYLQLPASLSEIGICLWLLIVGVNVKTT